MPLELQRLPSTRELICIAHPTYLDDTLSMLSDVCSDGKSSCHLTPQNEALASRGPTDAGSLQDTQCQFFEFLPREIRDEIYRYALGNLSAAFMHGKTQVRATHHIHKGPIVDTYKAQIPWMRASKQMYQEATEQFYHLARFNMDLDMRYKFPHVKGVTRRVKIRHAPTLTRARFLSVVNLTVVNLRQTEGLTETLHFDAETEQYKALIDLFPRMVALRQLKIQMKLKVPPCDEFCDSEYQPSLLFIRSLPRASLARLCVEIEYAYETYHYSPTAWTLAANNVVSRLSDPLKREVEKCALHAVRGDDHQWKEWKEELAPNVRRFIHLSLGFDITMANYR
ncbi:hypothetical protein J4E93_002483 [Alternaria ventricosa]|uniref:uncharacterized protein n=1 Tax=Alternaria ventricosa TaxID=1187951 RepID=UPI0020C200B5|nr:uncharacterized protein J4E93_002483 [Alternaria ventricosa]KAI4652284.1 hypothetical protein J4E93_002483 [Alternaria ventricosa]